MSYPYPCDETENEPRPVQLILRNALGQDVDTLNIYGKEYGGEGVTMLEGYDGFEHADVTIPRESGAYMKGSKPSEIPRENERIMTVNLGTQAPTAARCEDVETRLWKFLSPFFECVMRVYSHRSEPREIGIRLERRPKSLIKRKGPGMNKVGAWECVLLACKPDWQSQELRWTVKRSEMTDIGGGVYEKHVPIVNYGDQPSYPLFASNQLEATTTVTLPDRNTGRTVTLPPLTAGREFLVRTDPMLRTLLVRDNTLQWAKMNARAFDDDPIPRSFIEPYTAPIRIQGGTANTEVTMYIPQYWQRVWGGEIV